MSEPSFTLPPDTRAAGSPNPPLDVNELSDAVGLVFGLLSQRYTAQVTLPVGGGTGGTANNQANINLIKGLLTTPKFGSVMLQPSGDTSGVTDTALIRSALSTYGQAQLVGGSFYVNPGNGTTTGIIVGPQQALCGAGAGNTAIYVVGGSSGQPGITFRNASFPTSGDPFAETNLLGWCGGFTVDGSNGGNVAGTNGIEIGDIYAMNLFNVVVKSFTGAGSVGVRVYNRIGWTERVHAQLEIDNCANAMNWDVNTGVAHTSHAYSYWWVSVHQNASQNGFQLLNGATIYGGGLYLFGNFNTGAGNTGIAIQIGADSNGSQIHSETGNIVFETDGLTGLAHQDIVIGTGARINIDGNLIYRGGGGSLAWAPGSLISVGSGIQVSGNVQSAVAGNGAQRPFKSANTAVALGTFATTALAAVATAITPTSGWNAVAPVAFYWTVTGANGTETITLTLTWTYASGAQVTQTDTLAPPSGTADTKSWNASQIGGMWKSVDPAAGNTINTPALPASGVTVQNTAANTGGPTNTSICVSITGGTVTQVWVGTSATQSSNTQVGNGTGTYQVAYSSYISFVYTGSPTMTWTQPMVAVTAASSITSSAASVAINLVGLNTK